MPESKIMDSEDWSSSMPEFMMADAILRDHIDIALSIIRQIVTNGTLLKKEACYNWPLFRELRGNMEFLGAYREIFGHDYVSDLGMEAAKSKNELNKSVDMSKARNVPTISDNIAGMENFAQEQVEEKQSSNDHEADPG